MQQVVYFCLSVTSVIRVWIKYKTFHYFHINIFFLKSTKEFWLIRTAYKNALWWLLHVTFLPTSAGGISGSMSSSLESVKQLISLRLLKSTHPARPSDWLKSVPLLSHGMKFKYLYKHFYWLFCPACRILTTHTQGGKNPNL